MVALLVACSNTDPIDDDQGDAAVDEVADDGLLRCDDSLASRPDRVKTASPSPDGKGWCCAAFPSCECSPLGGFVKDRCECGGQANNSVCDLAPPDWIPRTDEHGCKVYGERATQTACCNCPR